MVPSEKWIGEETGLEVLLNAARPEIFRANGFRIMGLPVDASAQALARQVDKLRMSGKYGGGNQNANGPLALDPPPADDRLRAAIQRLRDPELRLLDEFFWFWPTAPGGSREDEALTALARGDEHKAVATWTSQEREPGNGHVAMHNLAVLSHVKALDLEVNQQANGVSSAGFWPGALQRWKLLMDDEGFWSRLTNRIVELQDPRLPASTARRMRESLPLALLLINAQLALRAAQAGVEKEAQRHVGLMREAGFGEEVVQKALRRVVEPMRQLIKTLCEAAQRDRDTDIKHADTVARRLLDNSAPLLAAFDCLLPVGDAASDGVHDEVALQALTCVIGFGNNTENWRISVELLERVLPIAASESARLRIQENLDIFRGNNEFGTCFFCGKNPAETNQQAGVPMHGDVKTSYVGYNRTRTTWSHNTFNVPRCGDCARIHRKVASARSVGRFLAFLSVATYLMSVGLWAEYLFGQDAAGWYIFLGLLTALIVPLYLWRAVGRALLKDSRPEEKKYEFSTIVERKKQGWRFGLNPQGVPAVPKYKPSRGKWLGDWQPFQRWACRKQPIFVSMFALWVPVPLILALVPVLWGIAAGAPASTRDLYRIGVLSKSSAAQRLSDAAADARQVLPYRERALQALATVLPDADPAGNRAVANLRMITRDPDPALLNLRQGAWRILMKALPEAAVETLAAEISSSDPTLRIHAAVNLQAMGPAARRATEVLTAAMNDSNSTVSDAATQTLLKVAPEAVIPKLIADLKSSGWQVRVKAAQLLSDIGPPAQNAIPALEQIQRDQDIDVRKTVASALHAIDPTGHPSVKVESAAPASRRAVPETQEESPRTFTPPAPVTVPQLRLVTPQVPDASALRASSLRLAIDSDKLQLSSLASSLSNCQRQLGFYQNSLDSDRRMLDQMQSNARLGLNVDSFSYNMTRDRYNSNVNLFNSQMQTCRSIAQDHDSLVDRINSKVREYNTLVGK